ncbi:glycoside hydrolase family 15 protein [Archangium violaceum]|uniref:glycoside hydrolase family 15 protein n=1 Tax=Archangium violaceum TaxID=83451 RepID=UPI000698B0E5|nr:glycoside hydrolase family 15 protein [Archangium violaceum]
MGETGGKQQRVMDGGARQGDLPLRDYALIGDGHTAALVARDGSVDWLCPGRFDAPAVFCRLLDARKGGFFRVGPVGPARVAWRYVGHTNILETEWQTPSGRLRVTDLMPLPARAEEAGSRLLRRVECLAGQVDVAVDFVPTPDYARAEARLAPVDGGWSASGAGQGLRLVIHGGLAVQQVQHGVRGHFVLHAGEVRWLALTAGREVAPRAPTAEAAEAALAHTQRGWEEWSARGRYDGPYADVLRRSALLLKLLTHTPTGAVVAAPTTSLPEAPGGRRNWDYRFCWLRDSAWSVEALMGLGYHDESMAFLGWLKQRGHASRVPAILYAVDGTTPKEEVELPHLAGWRGSRPVRVGNGAAAQRQNDVFGEVVNAIYLCSEAMPSMRPLEPELWALVTRLADVAAERWHQPGRGMWELRGPSRHFLTSRLLCWVALDRALKMARRDGLEMPERRDTWERAREGARRSLLEEGFHSGAQAFTWAIGEEELGAGPLLLPRYGLLPADDPRMAATEARLAERLADGGLLRRYAADDGLPGREGTFTACNFWWVDFLALAGRLDEAHALFGRLLEYANDLGLMSEEVDPRTGELWGNHPQGFTHLTLIRAALTLGEAETRRRGRAPAAPAAVHHGKSPA